MRQLTSEENKILAERKAKFDKFLNERMPVLVDFISALNIPSPHYVLLNAENFIDPLDSYLKNQTIEEEDKNWLITRIGYFLGELFVQKFGGYWFINETPDTRTFLRYVVGGFGKTNSNIAIDPFEIAKDYANELDGRSLKKYIEEIYSELR